MKTRCSRCFSLSLFVSSTLYAVSLVFPPRSVAGVEITVGGYGSRNAAVIDAVRAIVAREFATSLRVYERQTLNYSRNAVTIERDVCSVVSDGPTPAGLLLTDDGTSLALTVSPEATLDVVGQVFQLPIFVTGDYVRPDSIAMPFTMSKSPVVYSMRPQFITAIRDLINRYNWRELLYIFDSPQGLKRARQLQFMLHSMDGRHRTRIHFFALSNTAEKPMHQELRTIDKWRTNNRPIMGPSGSGDRSSPVSTIETVLRAVVDLKSESKYDSFLAELKDMGMNRAAYHWLLYTPNIDGLDLRGFEKGGCNVTGFRLTSLTDDSREALPLAWVDELQSRGILVQSPVKASDSSSPSLYRMSLDDQLLFDALLTTTRIATSVRKSPTPISARPFSCPTAGQRFVNLTMFYKAFNYIRPPIRGITGTIDFENTGVRSNPSLKVAGVSYLSPLNEIGFWNQEEGLKHFYIPSPNVSLITPNKTIRVVSVYATPFLRNRTTSDGRVFEGNDRYEGFCVDLAEKVFKMLGLQYEIHIEPNGGYGSETNSSGKWNGMIGELLDGTADVAIAALTITSARERVVSFTNPFLQTGISIMIKKPEKQKPGVFSFMDPLSTSIWMCIIFAYAGVSLALFLVSRFSPYEWRSMIFAPQATLQNTMWGTLGAIMQQGGNLTPHSFSGRLVASVWWFFCLILISSYTANLAAFLTIERMLTPIESVQDLAKQTEIHYGTLSGGSTQDYFRNARNQLHSTMWAFMKRAQPSVFVSDTAAGVERVLKSKGKYAFLLESVMNEYFNQRKPCDTTRVGNDLDSKGYGIATQLYSDLKDDLNDAVLKLTESGDIQELHKKWWIDKGECPGENAGKDSSQRPLTLSNVSGIFYILITGLLCSMLSAGLEFIYNAHIHAHKFRIPFRTALRVQGRFTTHGLYLMCESALAPTGLMDYPEEQGDDATFNPDSFGSYLDKAQRPTKDWPAITDSNTAL